MINNAKVGDITLTEIVKRMMDFSINSTIFDEIDLKYVNLGEHKAYVEMLNDIENLSEMDFLTKYIQLLKDIAYDFDNELITDKKSIEEMSGYNNAIVNVLKLLSPELMFQSSLDTWSE